MFEVAALSLPLVLVVDDDQAVRTILSEVLTDHGYRVMLAAHGQEALDLLATCQPALILLDLWMPVMDGGAFAVACRHRGYTIPLVVMTAAYEAGRWVTEMGAAAYLGKPFDLPELLQVVTASIGGGSGAPEGSEEFVRKLPESS